MLGKLIVAAALAVSLVPAGVQAQPKRWSFDATGWTLLGKQSVDGRNDKDVINVSPYQGVLDELSIVVEDSDLDLKDFTVVFDNGERWSPKLAHTFKEGARSRALDLPGRNRVIKKIELQYANKRGGGKASLAVYGRDKKGGRPDHTPPPATGWKFDATGWTLLGSQSVDGRRDKDTIRVGNYKGAFDQLTLVVVDSDIDLKDFTVVFNNNTKWSPRLAHTFKEGARSRVIDLPGKDRRIARIELAYANLPGGGKAKVEVYGRDVGRPTPPPITKITWENKGWTQIGKTTVDGWRDRDKVAITNGQSYSEVMFVAAGSDVELHDVVITFGNNEKFSPSTRLVFKEGSRTRPIDLPGAKRKIRTIEFAFSNLPGGGRAQLEVWARLKDAGGADAPKKPY